MRKHSMARKVMVLLYLVLIAVVTAMWRENKVQAQAVTSPNDFSPRKIAETLDGTKVYEMMHQGCQIFIVERLENNTNHSPAAVGITTARNCK